MTIRRFAAWRNARRPAPHWFSRTQLPPGGAFVIGGGSVAYGTPDDYRIICVADEIAIPGPHNLENALAATAIAMCADVPPPVIRHTLRTFKGVEHRLERVRELDGVTFINDSKGTNVDSTLKAIATMAGPTVMILGGYDKQVDMGRLCRAVVKPDQKCGADRRYGRKASRLDEAEAPPTLTRGTTLKSPVLRVALDGRTRLDCALVPACASFDMYEDYERRGNAFKAIVGALEQRAP